jgi:phosphatidate cytidylyltransferase
LVLAPLPLIAIWLGGPFLTALTMIAAVVMSWEWGHLCGGNESGAGGLFLIAAVALAVIGAAWVGILAGAGIALCGAAVVWGIEINRAGAPARWMAAGCLWIGLPCIILLWLAQNENSGREILLWVFAIVWATDIGAYAVGRLVGGPRLAPRWSPSKTWAGLLGGIGCAAIAGWVTGRAFGFSPGLLVALVSAGLAIVEQFGDLAESVAKRRFGVKDASGLIPGHGGLLDRLDGLLAVIPVVALLTWFGGGNVLAWR